MYEIDARNWKSGKKFVNVYRCFNALNSSSSAARVVWKEKAVTAYPDPCSFFLILQTVWIETVSARFTSPGNNSGFKIGKSNI